MSDLEKDVEKLVGFGEEMKALVTNKPEGWEKQIVELYKNMGVQDLIESIEGYGGASTKEEYEEIAKHIAWEDKFEEFFKNFSETEKDFIIKEFMEWQKLGHIENLDDGDAERVMELAFSKEFASRADTAEMVYNAYKEFDEMEFTEIEE